MQFACGLHMFALVSHFRSCFHLGPCTRGDCKENNKATCSSIREDVTKWKIRKFSIQLQLWGVQNKWPHLKQKRPHHTAGNLWTCWSMTYSTTKMINWTDWTVLFCFSKLLSKLLCFAICLWIKTTSRRGFFNIFHIFSQHSREEVAEGCVCVCVLILVLCCFSSKILFLGRCIRPSTLTKIDVMPLWQTPLRCS